MTDDRPRRMRLGPRHRTQVTRDHVGQRVTVRHVVVEDGHEVVTDVVGELQAWDEEDQLTVQRRDGQLVRVDATTIMASRVIPHPPPPRRRPRDG